MKILNFGSLNIDMVYDVDNFVRPGETISSLKMEKFAGGKGLNQSIALSKAGADVYHAGMIGNDGEFLKEILKENNVDTTYLKSVDGPSGHAIIQVDKNGHNCILLYSGSNSMINEEFVDNVWENFDKGDLILLQNEISCLAYIIDKAHEKGLTIALNPSPMNEIIRNCNLGFVDYFILNEVEAELLTSEKNIDSMIKKLNDLFPSAKIVLTLGEQGSIYSFNDILLKQDVFKVEAVDTTAAGDTFTGFFLSSICNGISPKEALKISSKASSMAVCIKGAGNSIPKLNDVLKNLSPIE